METLAAPWIDEHPEYHAELADVDAALAADYDVEDGRTNPFLHLSMHLSISEQVAIDQPRGIKQAVELLAAKRGSLHEAQHEVMECLGEMIWASQRSGLPPDGAGLPRARAAARDATEREGASGLVVSGPVHGHPLHLEPVVGAVHDVDVAARRPRNHLAVQRDRGAPAPCTRAAPP